MAPGVPTRSWRSPIVSVEAASSKPGTGEGHTKPLTSGDEP